MKSGEERVQRMLEERDNRRYDCHSCAGVVTEPLVGIGNEKQRSRPLIPHGLHQKSNI